MRGITRRIVVALVAAVVLALGLAACGSDSDSSAVSGGTTGTTEATEAVSASDSLAAAKEVIAPYVGQPSPFPVTEKLKEVPKGATIAYMDCGTPVCALFWELLGSAAQTMGVNVERIKTGSAANSVATAFDSVVAKEPDAVIVVATSIELWKNQLKQLQEADIPVVTDGITDTETYGIKYPQYGNAFSELVGELMASYVFAEMNPKANAVIYEVPELSFAGIIADKFVEKLQALCPECSVRKSQVGVEEIGTKAPNTIVSDLQANPDTNVAVFPTDELEIGLPAALQAAGIDVETLGNGPGSTNLQYIKEGKQTVGLANDLAVLAWTLLDLSAREIIGQEPTGPEAEGVTVMQFLTKEDITFDPSKGWTGYPDFAERFAKLWGVGG